MNYNRIAKNVSKALTKNGQSVILRQYSVGGGDYDPATQTTSPTMDSYIDFVRKALTTDQPGTRIGPQYGTNMQKGTLIQDSEKWMYLDAAGPAPRMQDHMIIQNIEYSIVDVQVADPGGIPLYYLIVCRK